MTKQATAARRARVMRWVEERGESVSAACQLVGISRSTFYRWRARYDPSHPGSLKARSRRPHRTRTPRWTPADLALVAEMNRLFPLYGKRRLHRMLAADGVGLSESAVGRILARVRAGCPFCGGKRGRHRDAMHALRRDLAQAMPDHHRELLERLRTPGRRPTRAGDVGLTPRGAVRAAEELLSGPSAKFGLP